MLSALASLRAAPAILLVGGLGAVCGGLIVGAVLVVAWQLGRLVREVEKHRWQRAGASEHFLPPVGGPSHLGGEGR